MNKERVHNLSIFIDAGFYNNLQLHYHANFDFVLFKKHVEQVLSDTVGPLNMLHVFYYDCLPFADGSESDSLHKRQTYFNFLRTQPGVIIREGTVMRHGDTYIQKGVDMLLGLDMAEECNKGVVTLIGLVAGDADFLPAIRYASSRGVQVCLLHGPKGTYADSLWSSADKRIEIDSDFVSKIARQYNSMHKE